MTATSTRLTIPRFRNTTKSNSPAVFPHNRGGCLRAAVPSSGGVRMPPPFFVPKLRHLLGRKHLIMEGLGRRNDTFGPIVRCRARVREAAFPCMLHFRDSRSTILNFTFDTVASDHWISAFLAWPLSSTTSIPRRVSGCAATSLRASLFDRCWCAAGYLWRAARGDTR